MVTKQKLFQYAILLHPTENEKEKGSKSKIIVEPKTVLASDQNSAALAAAMEIPLEYKQNLDNIEVVVRPF